MAISIDTMFDKINDKITSAQSKLEAQIDKLDPSKPGDMATLQKLMGQWTMMNQLQSTTVNQVTECVKGIIQKMN